MSNLPFDFKKQLIAFHVERATHAKKCGDENGLTQNEIIQRLVDLEMKLMHFLLNTFHDCILSTKMSLIMLETSSMQVPLDMYGKCREETDKAVLDWISHLQRVYKDHPPQSDQISMIAISQEAAKNAVACKPEEPNITNKPPESWED